MIKDTQEQRVGSLSQDSLGERPGQGLNRGLSAPLGMQGGASAGHPGRWSCWRENAHCIVGRPLLQSHSVLLSRSQATSHGLTEPQGGAQGWLLLQFEPGW